MHRELRVLVVDDDADSATSLSQLLRSLHCRSACAFGGATAVRIAELFVPDLVFLDLELPEGDGCELLARIRAVAKLADAMFVCLTGTSTAEAEQRCVDAGFDVFLCKPLSPAALTKVLTQARARIWLGEVVDSNNAIS